VKALIDRNLLVKGSLTALLIAGATLLLFSGPAAAEDFTLTPAKYDPQVGSNLGDYIPGETFTATLTGMDPPATRGYDLQIQLSTNTTPLMPEWNKTADAAGNFTWTFTIPADWEGTYYILAYNNNTTSMQASDIFVVRLFKLFAQFEHTVYLPGDTVQILYFTQKLEDQRTLDGGNGRWRMTIYRENGSSSPIVEPIGNSFSGGKGTVSFTLPTGTLENNYALTFTFNDTTDKHSVSMTIYLDVGEMTVDLSLNRNTYEAGDSIVVTVYTYASHYYSEELQGVAVATKVSKFDKTQGTWGDDSSYTVPGQTTAFDGRASFVIIVHDNSVVGDRYRVTVTGTRSGTNQDAVEEFTIVESSTFYINLELDQTTYKPGDTMKASVVITTTNASLRQGTMYQWTFTSQVTGEKLSVDYTDQANKTFVIPTDFIGSISVNVVIYTPDDKSYSYSRSAQVFVYALLINPNVAYYAEGQTIGVDATVVSDRISAATFIWTVVDSTGDTIVADGRVQGTKTGHFEFTIPSPSDSSYTIMVTASGDGVVVSDSYEIEEGKYVALTVDIPDQSFKPGDTVPITWRLQSVGGATIPATTTLTVYLSGGFGTLAGGTRSFEVAGSSGTIQYTIPTSAPSDADLQLSVYGSSTGSSGTSLFMRPGGGATPASAANGNAMIGIFLGVFGVILGLVALMTLRKMGGGGAASSPSSYSSMKPESSTGGGSSGSPPMGGASSDKSDGKPPM
jgi:hypothetical protein